MPKLDQAVAIATRLSRADSDSGWRITYNLKGPGFDENFTISVKAASEEEALRSTEEQLLKEYKPQISRGFKLTAVRSQRIWSDSARTDSRINQDKPETFFVLNQSGMKISREFKTFKEAVTEAKRIGKGAYVENDEGQLEWEPRGDRADSNKAANIDEIFRSIKRQRLLEDRREYMPEDLKLAYGLKDAEAQKLYDMIQREFRTDADARESQFSASEDGRYWRVRRYDGKIAYVSSSEAKDGKAAIEIARRRGVWEGGRPKSDTRTDAADSGYVLTHKGGRWVLKEDGRVVLDISDSPSAERMIRQAIGSHADYAIPKAKEQGTFRFMYRDSASKLDAACAKVDALKGDSIARADIDFGNDWSASSVEKYENRINDAISDLQQQKANLKEAQRAFQKDDAKMGSKIMYLIANRLERIGAKLSK